MAELLAVLGTRLTGAGTGETEDCDHPGLFEDSGAAEYEDLPLFDHAPGPAPGPGLRAGQPQECRICPVCLAIRALRNARPEVVEHLEAATTNLLAAARAVLAPAATDPAGAAGGTWPGGSAGRAQGTTRRPPPEHIDITE